jgi:hypothetical protein
MYAGLQRVTGGSTNCVNKNATFEVECRLIMNIWKLYA